MEKWMLRSYLVNTGKGKKKSGVNYFFSTPFCLCVWCVYDARARVVYVHIYIYNTTHTTHVHIRTHIRTLCVFLEHKNGPQRN